MLISAWGLAYLTSRTSAAAARSGGLRFRFHEHGSVADNLGTFSFNSGWSPRNSRHGPEKAAHVAFRDGSNPAFLNALTTPPKSVSGR